MLTIDVYFKNLLLIALHPHLITCKTKYIFLFSHMRSRSSVLSHIIGSNSNVIGYYESHRSYSNYKDLMLMKMSLHREFNCDLKSKYLFDKILHNRFVVSKEILKSINTKVILLLREPVSTIKSIINMGFVTGKEWYKSPHKAADYYCSRLLILEKISKEVDGDYLFIDSNSIIHNTDFFLESLTKWLNLTDPLEKSYSTFCNTGKPGFGDPLKNIHSGMIKNTPGYDHINVPLSVLRNSISAYEACKECLIKNQIHN